MRQPRPEVSAVLAGARLDEVEEDVARLEDAGVVGEQAEHGPHQKTLQIVAPVARRAQSVIQSSNPFGGLDVGRVLVAEGAALHAQDEAERFDMAGQVGEREGNGLTLVEIVQLKGLEVADQNVAGAVALGECVEIRPGLIVGAAKVAPGALLLDDQDTRPEQVDKAGAVVQFRHMRLVTRDSAAADPEYLEELVVEALRLALLIGRVPPFLGKTGGTGANLVPRQAHQAAPSEARGLAASSRSCNVLNPWCLILMGAL
ncbi:hypothetical protein NKDENANG_03025 [Candidatus Entotheonellaceae bacterium PAL068K]